MTTPTHRIKSADLIVPGTAPEHTAVKTILLSLPRGNGGIFGLVDICSRQEDDRDRLTHIVSSHLEVMRADIIADDVNIPRRFEAMLVAVNADIARFAETRNIPLKHVNIVVGVMTNTQVFLSGVGVNHILFLHRTADRRYVVYELDAQLANQESTWEKLLVTVLDGELHPGDVLYIASRIPLNALNLGDLQDILVTLPPNGALDRIQQFVPVTMRYGGVCFHIEDDLPSGPPKKTNPMASLTTLEETKTRTADLLGDQTPNVTKKVSLFLATAKLRLSQYSNSPLARNAKRIMRTLLGMFERILQKNTQPSQRRRVHPGGMRSITDKLATLRHAGITRVKGASYITKIVGAAAIVLVVVLGFSITTHQSQRQAAEASVAYNALITKIEEKRTAAEAAIIYGNTQDAQMFLTDAAALIATLPQDTSVQKSQASDLALSIDELLQKTRGLETVTPVKIAELPAQFAFPLTNIVSTSPALYGVAADAAPWRVNEISKALERVDVGTSPAQNILVSTSEDGNILSVDMDKRLWRTSPTLPAITALTSGTESLQNVTDIFSYNANLYVLSSSANQVIKMRPQGLGFEAGTPWITEKATSLTEARALAIDGNIWVLTSTDIVKFASGREVPWAHAAIDPALVSPKDIWTDITSLYLYILDTSDGRVVVMNKESGGIVAQYVPNISGVAGFTVREDENRIILTTATSVYSFTATHLLK